MLVLPDAQSLPLSPPAPLRQEPLLSYAGKPPFFARAQGPNSAGGDLGYGRNDRVPSLGEIFFLVTPGK